MPFSARLSGVAVVCTLATLLPTLCMATAHGLSGSSRSEESTPPAAASSTKPNFMIILADDVGVGDIGSWGAPTISTPNIDELARTGRKLTQFYAMAPICSPSRASLLTGRLPIRTGVYTNTSYPLDLIWRVFFPSSVGCLPVEEVTIADHLRAHGYRTSMIGKWHLGHNPANNCTPNDQGFDYFYGLPYSHEEGFPGPELESIVWPPVPLFENRELIQQPVNMETLTPRYTNKTLNLLDEYAASGEPFLHYIGYAESHVPLFAAPEFQGISRRGPYGDTTTQMDASIGQIIAKLKETGLDQNTYVIFSSDNGAWVDPGTGLGTLNSKPLSGGSNAPFRGGKGSTWEGGMREPAIVWAPGRVPAGTVSMEPVTMMDLLPTFSELAGIPNPPGVILDGKSIVSVIQPTEEQGTAELAEPIHQAIFYWREHVLYATRYGPWKAHFFTRPGFLPEPPTPHDPPLLFQIEHDPAERLPINATLEPVARQVLATIEALSRAHVANITRGVSQYEAQSWAVVPCCHKAYNKTQATGFWDQKEYGLAVWDECVCSDATTRPKAL